MRTMYNILPLLAAGLLLFCLLPCSAQLANSAWPAFGHDAMHTGKSSLPGPSTASPSWRYKIGAGFSSPVVGNNAIYVIGGVSLYALSFSGNNIWLSPCGNTSRSAPAISADGTIYVASSDGYLYAFEPVNGRQLKSIKLNGPVESSPAIGPDGTIYVACTSGRLQAYRSDGAIKFTYPSLASPAVGAIKSSPAIANDGTIYFGSDDGYLYALYPNGTLKWKYLTTDTMGKPVGSVRCSPAIGPDGRIYFGTTGGYFFCVYSTGSFAWRSIPGPVYLSPAVADDGTVYFCTVDGNVYSYKSGGSFNWRLSVASSIYTSPAIGSDGVIYITANDGAHAIDSTTGREQWNYPVADGVASSPVIGESRTLYFVTGAGDLQCMGADTTKPLTPFVTDDKISSLPDKLHAKWSVEDPESGIANCEYAIGTAKGAQNVVSFTSVGTAREVTATGLNLINGQTYYFSVRATNNVGLVSDIGTSDGVKVDYTPPTVPIVQDSGAFVSIAALTASWSAVDLESGIARYEYAIGSSPGAWDILPFTDAGSATGVTRADLSLADGKTYYFAVRAINGAGLVSGVGVSDGITLDSTPPAAPVVKDDGIYSTQQTTLHASWTCSDPDSGIARVEYAIGTSPGSQDLVEFTSVGTATEITRNDLALENGSKYYFSVRAVNGAGLISNVGISDGITVDFTPPATPVVIDDGKYTGSADTLHFVYASGDTESGIDHYEYSIGTAVGLTDVLGWQNAGQIKEQTVTGLSLMHGASYYMNVRAYNHAGLMSVGSSNGILVDLTPPPAPVIAVTAATTNEIKFNVTATDPESGIAGIQYTLLTSPTLPPAVQWIDATPGSEIIIPGPFDAARKYYVAVRASNKVGLWSEVSIAPAVMDKTPPSVPIVTDDGDYWADATVLHATWAAQDAESGIASYSYCIGSAPGTSDIYPWTSTTESGVTVTGLSLANGGKYYFSVKATNGVGLESAIGSSDGITIDTTPPSQPVVSDDGDYTSMTDSLHASYLSSDAQSGVIEYAYCVGTAPGASDVVGWTSAGQMTSITAYNLTLTTGVRYYISVKARNGAGLWSAAGTSDGIEYRPQVAVWPKFRCDSANAGRSEIKACATGRLNWSVQTQGYVESSAAIAGDGTAYIGSSDGKLYAINSNGTIRWTYATGAGIDSSPAIGANGDVYIGSYDGYLYCIQPNGKLEWKYGVGNMIWSSPCLGTDGSVFFGCQDGFVYALKPDGTLKWKFNAGSPVWSSPALGADGSIYFACGNGRLYALNSSGALKWLFQTGTAADSSPAVASSGVIYFGSGDGYFYAINPSGTLKWRVVTGNLVDSSAAIAADGTVYVGTGGAGITGTFRAFTPDGTELWRLNLSGGVRSSPAIDGNGNIYFGASDGKVHAVKPDGTSLWIYNIGQSVLSSPAIGVDGQVIVGSDDGKVYSFKDYPDDKTPPTTPVLTVADSFVLQGGALGCRWSASDLESGIESYFYAVGTQPGLADVVPWTNCGTATSASRSDLLLTVGQSYYFAVKARNHAMLTSSVGVSSAITVMPRNPVNLIGVAKKQAEGTRVYLLGKIVTAVYADCVFIEEPDRSAGIRCPVAASDLRVGDVVDISGKIATQNGEIVITGASFSRVGAAGSVSPIGMSLRSLALGGIDTNGLLVRVSGQVVRTGAYYFILSDGAKVNSPRGLRGVEIRIDGANVPDDGAFVTVTGVACREAVNGIPAPVIRSVSSGEWGRE